MSAGSGVVFNLYVDTTGSGSYQALGSMRTTSMEMNNETIDITTKDTAGFRELLDGGGLTSMTISGAGVFKDDANFEIIRAAAFSKSLRSYQIRTVGGHIFQGSFQVSNLAYSGEVNGAEEWSLTLESSGVISYTA